MSAETSESLELQAESTLMDNLLKKKQNLIEEKEQFVKRIQDLDHEITYVQCHYGTLYNRYSILSTIPNEILGLIFTVARDLGLNIEDGHGKPSVPIIEVIISHVCSHWRKLALSLPALWTRFKFTYQGPPTLRVPTNRLDAYLSRSTTLPLDLCFNFTRDRDGDIGRVMQIDIDMLRSLIPRMHRFRQFIVLSDAGDSDIEYLYQDLEYSRAPLLESFAMCPDTPSLFEDQDELTHLNPTILKGGAPNLRYVKLDVTTIPTCIPPLQNVTWLRIEHKKRHSDVRMDWPTFIQLLTLPFLNCLSIYGQITNPPADDFIHREINMNCLKHLRYGHENIALHHILPYLSAPLLKSLTFNNLMDPITPDIQPKKPPFPSLRTLVLADIDEMSATDPFLPYLAGLTAGITHLILSDFTVTSLQAINDLSRESEDTTPWRQVETLTCNFPVTDLGFSSDVCLQFSSSHPKVNTIRVPELTMDDWITDDLVAWDDLTFTFETLINSSDILPHFWPLEMDSMVNDDDPFELFLMY